MPATKYDQAFADLIQEDIIEVKVDAYSALDKAISWIKENLPPTDVFTEADLLKWAADGYSPDEVFEESDLEAWAIANGYTKES
jgi:hypothetical protein